MIKISKSDEKGSIIDVSSYQNLNYPKNTNARYSNLHGVAMELIEAVKNNQVLYKKKLFSLVPCGNPQHVMMAMKIFEKITITYIFSIL